LTILTVWQGCLREPAPIGREHSQASLSLVGVRLSKNTSEQK